MRRLRAGLVGHGAIGRNHARVLSELDGVDFVGVVDPVIPKSRAPVFDTLERLLSEGIDYCVVAVPTAKHEEIALQLCSEGVHSLIEKPLAHDLPAARRVVEAFESARLVSAVGHIERFNPALQHARSLIQTGEVGRILHVATRRQGPMSPRVIDVGVVKDLATHDIDLTVWLTQSEFRSISARTDLHHGREHEDLVSIVGRLEDGTVTNHIVNRVSPYKERLTVITTERGALVADTLHADLTFHSHGDFPSEWDDMARVRGLSEGDVIRYAFPKPEPLRVEHEAFRDAVLGLDSQVVPLADGLAALAVAEAALLSAATQSDVDPSKMTGLLT